MNISADVQPRHVEANDGQSHGAGNFVTTKLSFVCVTVAILSFAVVLSQSMMSNPDLIRQMILSNPQMQQLIEVCKILCLERTDIVQGWSWYVCIKENIFSLYYMQMCWYNPYLNSNLPKKSVHLFLSGKIKYSVYNIMSNFSDIFFLYRGILKYPTFWTIQIWWDRYWLDNS